ncbi:MAG: hypothetical protein LQ352_002444 [Teloschistes flavicans]|nr:MAG: hypothetical protein LQ352_002444 [Teloschistes flavicans]
MAVSLLQASISPHGQRNYPRPTSATDAVDMDIDMDIDLGPIDGPEAVEVIVSFHLALRSTLNICETYFAEQDLPEQSNHIMPAVHGNEHLESNTAPHKVHLRGLDDLTTTDIELFASEHHPSDCLRYVEWIDDISANIVYDTSAAAIRALISFTSSQIGQEVYLFPSRQLRAAKSFSARAESRLEVRIAMTTDVKRPRAHEASRFYMLHPEHDPREKKRKLKDYNDSHGYPKRRYDDRETRQKRFQGRERRYDASMYDDETRAPRNRGSASSASMNSDVLSAADRPTDRRGDSRSGHAGDYYRPMARDERKHMRSRSASPGMDERAHQDITGRRSRQRSPPTINREKELFPIGSSPITSSITDRELFPNKIVAASLKKELFPAKAGNPRHRRSDAFDAADDAADLFATGMAFSDARGPSNQMAAAVGSSGSRLLSSDPTSQSGGHEDGTDTGINIRGASMQQDSGIAIFGAAAKSHIGTIQELFPNRMGNSGKELFAEKLQGRGLRRNKAEDMFY